MIDVNKLKQIFNDKLTKTGSLDEAFTKAMWTAYKQGLEDAFILLKDEFPELYEQLNINQIDSGETEN